MAVAESYEAFLRRVAQNRKKQIMGANPRYSITERLEIDQEETYLVLTLKIGGKVDGYEFIENDVTYLSKAKGKRYLEIVREGLHLGILVPEKASDLIFILKVLFPGLGPRNPSVFFYDENGNIEPVREWRAATE